MFLQSALVLLVRVEVVENDVQRAVREGRNDAVHEGEKLGAAAPFRMLSDDPPGGDLERGEQGRSTVPLVVVAQGRPLGSFK